MLRRFILVLFVFSNSFFGISQEFEVWTEIGARYKINKKFKFSAELNTRFNQNGLNSIFPQLGLTYKVKKWLDASVEYRFVTEKNKFSNYKTASSFRVNLDASSDIDRLKYGVRVRYQYSFDHEQLGVAEYNADFDQAIRLRPSIKYDLNNFPITPAIQTEFFLNPIYNPYGSVLTKIRYTLELSLDTDSDHDVGVKYRIDQKTRSYPDNIKHIICLSYRYTF